MRRITLVLVLFLAPVALHAATMITSFGPSSSAIISGQSLGLSWAASEASGVSILLPCISGVRYRDEAGTAVSCGSKRTGFSNSGTMTLQVTNTGGGTVSVSPTIYPINLNGVEVAAAAETASFSVAASETPITDITANPSLVSSGATTTVTWIAPFLDQLNLMFACNPSLTIVLTSENRPVGCERYVFFTDRSGGTSIASFVITNNSAEETSVTLAAIPKIVGGYDATRQKTVTIRVSGKRGDKSHALRSFPSLPPCCTRGTRRHFVGM